MVEVGFVDGSIGVGTGGFVDAEAGKFGFCDVCHPYFDDTDPGNPVVSAGLPGVVGSAHGHHAGVHQLPPP